MIVEDHTKHVCVLLIEDSPDFRMAFRKLLETNRAVVYEAASHEEAVEILALEWHKLDLILLDACVEPPHIQFDAHRLLEIIGGLDRGQAPTVRILGFSSFTEHLIRMKASGCTHVCKKSDELTRVIPDLLSEIFEEQLSGEFEIPTKLKSR